MRLRMLLLVAILVALSASSAGGTSRRIYGTVRSHDQTSTSAREIVVRKQAEQLGLGKLRDSTTARR